MMPLFFVNKPKVNEKYFINGGYIIMDKPHRLKWGRATSRYSYYNTKTV